MDIKRAPKSKIKKKIRTAAMIVIGVAGIGGITYGLTKLKPAAPTLDSSTAVIETVKRGEKLIHPRSLPNYRTPNSNSRLWTLSFRSKPPKPIRKT